MTFSTFDHQLMKRLIRLAEKKRGKTYPNPLVAAALVKDQKIISIGVHQKAGTAHAEILAIQKAGAQAKGSTLYVTLEPCTKLGKSPSCTEAILKAGIQSVIYAMEDPNPMTRKYPAKAVLLSQNILVKSGLEEALAQKSNQFFIKNMTENLPYTLLKVGCSLDGKIALSSKESKYITHPESRKWVHQLRRDCNGILVGAGTVDADDPELTVRFGLDPKGHHNPTRILIDPKGRLTLDKKAFLPNAQVFWVVDPLRHTIDRGLLPAHIQVLEIDHQGQAYTPWLPLLKVLFEKGICCLLIEGGQKIFTSALQAGVIDEIYLSMAPTILGGAAMPIFDPNWEVPTLKSGIKLTFDAPKKVGPDLWLSGRFVSRNQDK